jgi:hypothetical protein
MYRGIIQYIDLVTKYLNDWIVKHDLQQGIHYGRIYRVVHDTTRRDRAPALGTASPATLVATLSHPNGWWRDSAQQLLVQRHDLSVVPSLKQLANGAPLARTRIQALWTLDGLDAIDSGDRDQRAGQSVTRCAGVGASHFRTVARRPKQPRLSRLCSSELRIQIQRFEGSLRRHSAS